VPLTQHLEPGFKRAASKSHQVRPPDTYTGDAHNSNIKGCGLKQSLLVQRIIGLSNTAGDKL